MKIAIIGDDEAGKATFLVLLYAAQILYSENDDAGFRFYINPKSIKAISSEYGRMQGGSWPTEKLIDKNNEVSFLIGRTDDSKKGFFKFLSKSKEPNTIPLDFSVYDFADSDLVNKISNSKMSFYNISDKIDSLLSSRILIIIIDSSMLKKPQLKPKSKEKPPVAEKNKTTQSDSDPTKKSIKPDNDFIISNALANISRYNKKMLYPVFVFTKFDSINKKILLKLKLPKKPPKTQSIEKRNKFGERLMSIFYPETLNLVKRHKSIKYEPGVYFFSSVKSVKGPEGKIEPALKKSSEVKYILDCTYQEFIEFIKYLEKISEHFENGKK